MKPVLPEYDSGVLHTRPRCTVLFVEFRDLKLKDLFMFISIEACKANFKISLVLLCSVHYLARNFIEI